MSIHVDISTISLPNVDEMCRDPADLSGLPTGHCNVSLCVGVVSISNTLRLIEQAHYASKKEDVDRPTALELYFKVFCS